MTVASGLACVSRRTNPAFLAHPVDASLCRADVRKGGPSVRREYASGAPCISSRPAERVPQVVECEALQSHLLQCRLEPVLDEATGP